MKTKMSTASFSTKVTREWLHEYKVLADAELHTFASTVRANDELIIALYQLFEDEDEPQEVLDPVCHQLFDFYRSDIKELKRFTLEFVPTLISAYLMGVANNDKKRCGGIEACLLGIYNLEVTEKDGSPRIERFTIPTIACPSIYHEPPSLATLALTESALITFHGDEHVVINHGPLPQIENITSQNRLNVLSHVMSCYNRDIANLSPRSHQKLCKMCSRLMTAGFNPQTVPESTDCVELNDVTSSTSSLSSSSRSAEFPQTDSNTSCSSFSRSDSRKSNSLRDSLKRETMKRVTSYYGAERRITLNSSFLVELLNSVYFVMFNGHARLGIQAVEDIHKRAGYQLWSDVLLVTNAIKNSLLYNPSGQPMEGPMGISIALSPTTSNPSFTKHAITNASFRTKKLPDDIPILDIDAEPDMAASKVSRPDSDLQKLEKPEDKVKRKKVLEKKEREKKSKKKDRNPNGEKGTLEEKTTLLTPNAIFDPSDDIDVPESPEGDGAPPTYDELLDQERGGKSEPSGGTGGGEKNKSGHMFSKPLKSIMKSGKDKMKMTRKDSDAKRKETAGGRDMTDNSQPSHSPRHSTINPLPTSQSLNISQSVSNGAIELDNITVAVVRSMSKSKVDQIELRNVAAAGGGGVEGDLGQHRRTSSFPEGGFTTSPMMSDMGGPNNSEASKPLLRPGTAEQSDYNHANDSEDEVYSTNL